MSRRCSGIVAYNALASASPPRMFIVDLYRPVRDFLEELSAQGLVFTFDKHGRTHWYWRDIHRWSEKGFWSLGEALDDALFVRYPKTFTHPDALPETMPQQVKTP